MYCIREMVYVCANTGTYYSTDLGIVKQRAEEIIKPVAAPAVAEIH